MSKDNKNFKKSTFTLEAHYTERHYDISDVLLCKCTWRALLITVHLCNLCRYDRKYQPKQPKRLIACCNACSKKVIGILDHRPFLTVSLIECRLTCIRIEWGNVFTLSLKYQIDSTMVLLRAPYFLYVGKKCSQSLFSLLFSANYWKTELVSFQQL